MVTARRYFPAAPPYASLDTHRGVYERGRWPCRWIGLASAPAVPFVAAYRCRVECREATTMRVHVTADERYVLYGDGRDFPWDFADGGGDGWQPVETMHEGMSAGLANRHPAVHLLTPGALPPMRRKRFAGTVRFVGGADGVFGETGSLDHWQNLVTGHGEIVIPEETREPEARTKGHRDDVHGKYFVGVGDTLLVDGGDRREWRGWGFQAGRFLQIEVTTGSAALTLHARDLQESRYPLEIESAFTVSDPRLEKVARLALRSLHACCHDVYIDGPYYEQMMWIGDARLKALANYAVSTDDPLARKALTFFNRSRLPGGFTRARWPARDTMIIAPHSLWWVGMAHDYALWRGDKPFVRGLLPGMRAVLDAFGAHENADGLIDSPPGWNFVDWAHGWSGGIPPGGDGGVSALLNWQYVLTLTEAAAVEIWLGEPLLAQRLRDRAAKLAARLDAAFWVEARGLFADDPGHRHFSEHTQALAVLSGRIGRRRGQRMLRRCASPTPDLARTTLYFTHYLFEAYARLDMGSELTSRLQEWFDYEKLGLTTLPESPEPARSDCHGWGAHVLYHFFATLLGIRPRGMGFERVSITPLACGVARIGGSLVHPRGRVNVEVAWDADRLAARTVTLPEGVQPCT